MKKTNTIMFSCVGILQIIIFFLLDGMMGLGIGISLAVAFICAGIAMDKEKAKKQKK